MKSLPTVTLACALLLSGCGGLPEPDNKNNGNGTPTPTPVTAVKIVQPAAGAKVMLTEVVRGTSQLIPGGQKVWVVVFIHQVGRYYPQNNPADIQANGDWASVSYIGSAKDPSGLTADLIAVLADERAQNTFRQYLAEARDRNDYTGLERLPDGAVIYDRVPVSRK